MSSTAATRTESERGQALIVALGALFVLTLGASVLFLLGSALAGKGRAQRAADLAALSAARTMRDNLDRLFEPATIEGRPNPYHLSKAAYLARAGAAAVVIGRANGARLGDRDVTFPDDDLAPSRVRVQVRGRLRVHDGSVPVAAVAVAEVAAPPGAGAPLEASGAGYAGPLAYRQGKPMRPDVARAFDRMDAAARADGVRLIVTSGYRSDAEQAELYERHPDPKWVAPPGKSLHRFGTELDLGPPSAYGWLARNARRFHFIQRYEWERWHYGYGLNPRSTPPPGATGAARCRRSCPPPIATRSRARPAAGTCRRRCSLRSFMWRATSTRSRSARRRARHRAVHAGDRAHVRPARSV